MYKCPFSEKEFKTISTLRRHLTLIYGISYEKHRNYIPEVAEKEDKQLEYEQSLKVCYTRLLYLTEAVQTGLDFNVVRQRISPKMKMKIRERDSDICYICNRKNSPHIHHRVPNGLANEENLYTLCARCHDVVHSLMYLDGKWKHRFNNR